MSNNNNNNNTYNSPDNKSLWEAAKESAHNIGVSLGVLNPSPRDHFERAIDSTSDNFSENRDVFYGYKDNTNSEVFGPAPVFYSDKTREKIADAAELTKEKAREAGVKLGIVEPTLEDKMKYNIDDEKISENLENFERNFDGTGPIFLSEKAREKISDAAELTKEKAHEFGVRMGLVQPTLEDQIKLSKVIENTEDKFWDNRNNRDNNYYSENRDNFSGNRDNYYSDNRDRSFDGPGPIFFSDKTRENFTNAAELTKEKAHEAGVKMGLVDPKPADKLNEAGNYMNEAVHDAGVKAGFVEPTFGDRVKYAANDAGNLSVNEVKQAAQVTKEALNIGENFGAKSIE